MTPITSTDMPEDGWIDRFVPVLLRPYLKLMRLDRPIGTWLLLWPCWWSLAMAAVGMPDWRLVGLFGIGAVIMRGAGCTFNDLVDRDYDAQVTRTRTRPIPSGAVRPWQAAAFLGLLLALGLLVLTRLNVFAMVVGAASLALVFTYPFMKRITYWPQAFLGLAFNWGALLGWAAANGAMAPAPLVLYAAGIAWTLGYDTIYAHQDREDDALIGVKSTALRFGSATKAWVAGFYALTLAGFAWAGWLAELRWVFLAFLGLAGLQLAWQVVRLDIDAPADCLSKFKSNRWFGWIVFAGILADKLAA